MKQQNKRTLRKLKGKRKILFTITFCIGILFLGTIGLAFYNKMHKPLFVTPTPFEKITEVLTGKSQDTRSIVGERLRQKSISFTQIQENTRVIIITLSSGEEIILSKIKSLDLQITSLQVILNRLTMEGRRIKQLDLRFDKPILISR